MTGYVSPAALPRHVLDRPDMRDALACRDFGAVFALARKWAGISFVKIADACDIKPDRVGRLAKGHGSITSYDKVATIADGLRIPGALVGLAPRSWETSTELQALALEDDDVDRRDVLKIASLTVAGRIAGMAPWDRLAHAVKAPHAIDNTTVCILQTRTSDLYRQEEFVTARQLRPSIAMHRTMLKDLLLANPQAQSEMLVSLGETEAIAGWTEFDLGNHRTAQLHLAEAIRIAEHVGDGPLRACALGYMSYIAEARDDVHEALRLLQEAQSDVTGSGSAATRSWLAAREAETAALIGSPDRAVRALERAYTAFDYARPHERSWTGFFGLARLGSLAVSTYIRLEHPLLEPTSRAVINTLAPGEEKVGAIISADLTVAAATGGDYDHAEDLAEHAVAITRLTEATLARDRLRDLARVLQHKAERPAHKLRRQLAAV